MWINLSSCVRKDAVTMGTLPGRVSAPSAGGRSTTRPGRSRSKRTGNWQKGKRTSLARWRWGVATSDITRFQVLSLLSRAFLLSRAIGRSAHHQEKILSALWSTLTKSLLVDSSFCVCWFSIWVCYSYLFWRQACFVVKMSDMLHTGFGKCSQELLSSFFWQ